MFGKILISCVLTVRTGLHIGASDVFSPIGAIDSQVVRDARTGLPIVPGSSLKGKMRSLLARSLAKDIESMPEHNDDDEVIKRLFGSSEPVVRPARLQFADCFVSNADKMSSVGFTEVKAENTINRLNSVANPRFIERVNAGTEFAVRIVYNLSDMGQLKEDFACLVKGMKLLQLDYLGGHGSRGSGRVSLSKFAVEHLECDKTISDSELVKMFKEVEDYELLPVQA